MSYLEKGYLDIENITAPDSGRLKKGPVAVIECVQEIPCNPCTTSCPRGAITIEGSINSLPVLDPEKCNGCSLCVANCPGLAIFLIDYTFSEDKAKIGIPYEFRPLPEKGEEVILINRAGKECGTGMVEQVRNSKAMDRTPIVFISLDKELAMEARFFRRKEDEK